MLNTSSGLGAVTREPLAREPSRTAGATAAVDGPRGAPGSSLFCLATPPRCPGEIATDPGQSGLAPADGRRSRRLISETPFGHDPASARDEQARVLLRILRREDWAQDVLQEVFVSVWRHAGEYAPSRGAAMPWLVQVARHRALDGLWRSRHEAADPDVDLEAIPDEGPSAEARVARDRDAALLHDCLGRLAERQRECVQVAYFEGLSHRELAQRLGVPIGTVKTWIRRGLIALKACLGP